MTRRIEHLAEGITLYLGDCREVLPGLGKVDAVVTDPPYGVNLVYASCPDDYNSFVSEIVPRISAALDIAIRGLVWTGPHIHEQRKPDAIGGVYCAAAQGRHVWGGFKQFLPVLLYGKSPTVAQGKGATCSTSISSSETSESNGHPVPKPLGWMRWSVKLASLAGETILDPFMGSGTTGVAAVKLGRKFTGIEIEPKYFDIACRRISEALRQGDLFIEQPKVKAVPHPSLDL